MVAEAWPFATPSQEIAIGIACHSPNPHGFGGTQAGGVESQAQRSPSAPK
jgi:hypothetical protein